jgi:hypothetical protein
MASWAERAAAWVATRVVVLMELRVVAWAVATAEVWRVAVAAAAAAEVETERAVKEVKKVPSAAVSAEGKVEAASAKVVAGVAVAATAAAAMVEAERTVETEDSSWRRRRR